MTSRSHIIIAEGDTGIARFFCGACDRSFRAELARVTTANKQPICLKCILAANPQREQLGLPPIKFVRAAYHHD